ncbi:MAG TPA: hypothetical protein VGJ35_03225 [Burkholderiaceae bacterium]|jgi:hypothetical protein
MSFTSLSRAYRIAPRTGDVARTPAPKALPTPGVGIDARARRDDRADAEGQPDATCDCDSVRRSPLLRALVLALQVSGTRSHDAVLERALIEFARALNLATGDVDVTPRPALARADETAQRRARNEEQLLVAFAELQHAAGRPGAPTREALQAQLSTFLHTLARHLNVADDRAGEATQPGSLISVQA